jgi:hypothetical protein
VHASRICDVSGISDVHDMSRISEVRDTYSMEQ